MNMVKKKEKKKRLNIRYSNRTEPDRTVKHYWFGSGYKKYKIRVLCFSGLVWVRPEQPECSPIYRRYHVTKDKMNKNFNLLITVIGKRCIIGKNKTQNYNYNMSGVLQYTDAIWKSVYVSFSKRRDTQCSKLSDKRIVSGGVWGNILQYVEDIIIKYALYIAYVDIMNNIANKTAHSDRDIIF